MNPGWNPARRNRHAGTAQHGYKRRLAFGIPDVYQGKLLFFHERLHAPVTLRRSVGGHELGVVVETPLAERGSFYPCTADDVCQLLAHCPPGDVALIDWLVLRQPTRKQSIFSSVWGRACFCYEGARSPGSAIVLEAVRLAPWNWPLSLKPEDARELQRLRADGHQLQRTRRHWRITPTAESLRHTLLYRTLLHELGHHVDHRHWDAQGRWEERSHLQKEDFAHRYAQTQWAALTAAGHAPFAALRDAARMRASGLDPAWFEPPASSWCLS